MRGRRATPKVAEEVESRELDPPDDMTTSGKEKWLQLVPLIASMTQIQETDMDALRQYCEACVIRSKAMKELEDQPYTLVTPNGAMQVNPLLKVISQQESVMMKLSERFGLDPASRKRLKISSKEVKNNPLLDFMNRGKGRTK